MEKLLLIGGGGHCKVVISAIKLAGEYEIAGIIDLPENIGKSLCEVPIIGDDSDLEKFSGQGIKYCIVTVGSVGDSSTRRKLYALSKNIGFIHANVIHPTAVIDKSVKMGEGNFFSAGVIINSDARLGNNCIVNTGAIIEHDCVIGDSVHIASGVVISGGVSIGSNSHIGTGTSIIQSIAIGKNVIIGAGSNVIKNIRNNVTALGNPCAIIKINDTVYDF